MMLASVIMPYFKDEENNLWWLDEDQSIDLIPQSCLPIEKEEADLIIEQKKEALRQQEMAQQPSLADLQARLNELTAQITALAEGR